MRLKALQAGEAPMMKEEKFPEELFSSIEDE
jgi:hypothetical protein